ncbi:MAG TPA: CocE/NonD family hydrolase [Segetibacter sp.]
MKAICLLLTLLVCLGVYSQQYEKLEARIFIKDSITLATDVYKPKGQGTWPVILIRTPYNKDQNQMDGTFFSSKGYVVVIQDVRGKYKSTGQFIPFINEIEDGIITMNWIIDQPWSNKMVGYYGSSYGGFCGLSLSDGKHTALKTIFNNAGWLTNQNVIEEGGATNLLLGMPWTYLFTRTNAMRRPNIRFDSLFKILPVNKMLTGSGFTDWWRDLDTLLSVNRNFKYQNVTMPIMHMTGWFDFTMKGTINFYERVSKFKHSKQKLVIGPWSHGQNYFPDSTKVGDEDLGVEAKYGLPKLRETALNWFNQHLKSTEPIDRTTEIFVLFDNKWVSVHPDLKRNTKFQRLYLFSERGANSKNGDGKLIAQKSSKLSIDTFTYDPLKPLPTNGGANFHFFPNYLGIRDQTKLQNRKDLLVYISEPMTSNTTIIGTPSIDLYVSSSAESTDFSVRLFMVDDSSSRKLLTDGIKRLSSSTNNFTPGNVHRIKIDLGSIGFSLKKGQRIGVEISSSNFPKFDRNLNTNEPIVSATTVKRAQQTVYHDKINPSSLSLPIYKGNK